jgi:selenocysteine-specific elongation factor
VAARRLGLADPALVSALVSEMVSGPVSPSLREHEGVLTTGGTDLPAHLLDAWAVVRPQLVVDPFDAPDRSRLRQLGLDHRSLAVLERAGHLLRVSEDVVLLPGAEQHALAVLATLSQPFSTSEARRALATSRRVALPLLDHLDRAGLTVRLPDDRRRLRSG